MFSLRLFGLTALVGLATAGTGRADLLTNFVGTTPSQDVKVQIVSGGTTTTYDRMPVGPFVFSVVSDSSGTFTPGTNNLRAFCADFFDPVVPGNQYTYQLRPAAGLPDVAASGNLAKIDRLYDRFYDSATDATNGGAFQLALWKLLYDGGNTNLATGNFTAAPAAPGTEVIVARAQNWLNGLDAPLPTDTDKYQLVGLFNGSNQDQLAVVETNPIPAPAGVLLGLVALAGFGARRRWRKAA